jgi:hypothetical protein
MMERKMGHVTLIAGVAVVLLAMIGSSLAAMSGSWTAGSASSGAASTTPAASGLSVAIGPNPAAVDVGQSVVLTATASGGTSPYKGYQWWEGTFANCLPGGNLPIPGATSAMYTTPVLTSSEYFCVNVTDSESPAVNVSSPVDLVTVNPDVVVAAPTPTAPTIDSGQTVKLTEIATYGTAPLNYQWYSGGATGCSPFDPISGATAATYTPTPPPTTTTSYCVVVGDHSSTSWAGVQSPSATVTVDPALAAPAPTPSGDYGDLGQSFKLTATPSGGTGSYSLQWYGGSSVTCSSDSSTGLGTAQTQTVTPTTTGSTNYCYTVTDTSTSAPVKASPTTAVVINATLTVGPISPSSVFFDLGTTTAEQVNLTAKASNGALTSPSGPHPTYRYQWRSGTYPQCGSDNSVTGATNPWLVVLSTSVPASLYYCLAAEDANNTIEYSSPVLVTVDPALSAPAPSPQTSQIDFGRVVPLTANPGGGTGPGTYSYQWFQGSGCTLTGGVWTLSGGLIPGATSSTVNVAPSVNGTTYFYRVTDSSTGLLELGQESECSPIATVGVNPALTPGAPTISVSTSIDLGQSVKLTRPSVPAGEGTPVIAYQWRSGTTSNCSADSNIAGQTGTTYGPIVPPAGTTWYCYAVTDGSVDAPLIASASVSVTVNSILSPGSISSVGTPYVDQGPGGTPSQENVTLLSSYAGVGGTAPYSYQWYAGVASTCSAIIVPADLIPGATGSTYTTPALSSTLAYCYQITDQSTPHEVANTTTPFLVTVELPLVAGKPAASLSSLDLGQSVTLTAAPQRGDPPYAAYQWFTASGPTCAGLGLVALATSSPATVTPTATGPIYFCYRVTDSSNGNPVQESAYSSAAVGITVYPALTVSGAPACKDYGTALWTGTGASCTGAQPGDHVTLTATPTGGNSSNYAYTWYNGTSSVCQSDPVMMGKVASSVNVIVPSTPGSYYCYIVNDGTHNDSATSLTYFLDPAPSSSSGASPAAAVPAAPSRTE